MHIGIGCGVYRRTAAASKRGPQWIAAQLTGLCGATLTGLWIGDDLGASGDAVASWPARVGEALVNRVVPTFSVTSAHGRKGIIAPDATNRLLHLPAHTISKSVICVTNTVATPPAVNYGLTLAGTWATGPYASHLALAGSSTWYAYAGSKWTHYRDGAASETQAAGVHIYQADKGTNDAAGIGFGSWGTDAPWPGAIYCGVTLNTVPSAGVRAAVTAVLRQYYAAIF